MGGVSPKIYFELNRYKIKTYVTLSEIVNKGLYSSIFRGANFFALTPNRLSLTPTSLALKKRKEREREK